MRRAPLALSLFLSGCSHAPAQNVVGSFFPSWLLCAALGATFAAAVRAVLGLLSAENIIVAPVITYLCIGLAATLAIWLIWFSH